MLEEIDEIRTTIQNGCALVRALSEDIGGAENLLFERIESLAEKATDVSVRGAVRTRKVFEAYVSAGFTEQQAMQLILNTRLSLQELIRSASSGSSKVRPSKKQD